MFRDSNLTHAPFFRNISVKDNFSAQADLYARFRPTYPSALFDFLLSIVPHRKLAWDCATGNGQLAVELASHFDRVVATDLSSNQIGNAVARPNIMYHVERAEHSSVADNSIDLITVGQAIHWFNFDAFYKEVTRTLAPDGIIAVIGYPLPQIDSHVDSCIGKLYNDVLASYWDPERRYVDEHYLTIPFPFDEIKAPGLTATRIWTIEDLVGYLNTWSGVQHFIGKHHSNPITGMSEELRRSWGHETTKCVTFPILLRIGRTTGKHDQCIV